MLASIVCLITSEISVDRLQDDSSFSSLLQLYGKWKPCALAVMQPSSLCAWRVILPSRKVNQLSHTTIWLVQHVTYSWNAYLLWHLVMIYYVTLLQLQTKHFIDLAPILWSKDASIFSKNLAWFQEYYSSKQKAVIDIKKCRKSSTVYVRNKAGVKVGRKITKVCHMGVCGL
jgi:hypothetical protein